MKLLHLHSQHLRYIRINTLHMLYPPKTPIILVKVVYVLLLMFSFQPL